MKDIYSIKDYIKRIFTELVDISDNDFEESLFEKGRIKKIEDPWMISSLIY